MPLDASVSHFPELLFAVIAIGLAAAAVIELAYTLFTPGPDEALDPLMLALAAALIFQFGHLEQLHSGEAIAALMYSIALGLLFAIKYYWRRSRGEADSD